MADEAHRIRRLRDPVPSGRLNAEQVPDEIVPAPPEEVRIVVQPVRPVRDDEQVEVAVGLDQGVDECQGGGGVDVLVHLAVDQEELAGQIGRQAPVRLLIVMGVDLRAHVALDPARFVETVVVVAGRGDADLVEVGVAQDGVGGGVAAGRVAVDPDPAEVEGGLAVAELADRGDVVGETGVAEVAVADVVVGARAPRHPQTVDHDDDEAQFGDRLRLPEAGAAALPERIGKGGCVGERRRRHVHLRPAVDVVDHRVAPIWIEPGRSDDDAVDVRHAVARLGGESLRRGPTGRQQRRDIGPLDLHDQIHRWRCGGW